MRNFTYLKHIQRVTRINPNIFARKVMLVSPIHFKSNPDTLQDNCFMDASIQNITEKAVKEHDSLIANIIKHDIEVKKIIPRNEKAIEACFCNNWFCTVSDKIVQGGLSMVFPLKGLSRRIERDNEIIENIFKKEYKNFVDLRYLEDEGEFLESTGCLIFNHADRIIYCALSKRATPRALEVFIKEFNSHVESPYELKCFNTHDKSGNPVYHTNVLMSVLEKHIVICKDAVNRRDFNSLGLNKSSKETIFLSMDEMYNFCGNIINVQNKFGDNCIVMSQSAEQGLSSQNRNKLIDNYKLVVSDISTIEKVGGGSVRCLIGELF